MIRKHGSQKFERKLLTTSNQPWTPIHGLLAHVNRATESQRPKLRGWRDCYEITMYEGLAKGKTKARSTRDPEGNLPYA